MLTFRVWMFIYTYIASASDGKTGRKWGYASRCEATNKQMPLVGSYWPNTAPRCCTLRRTLHIEQYARFFSEASLTMYILYVGNGFKMEQNHLAEGPRTHLLFHLPTSPVQATNKPVQATNKTESPRRLMCLIPYDHPRWPKPTHHQGAESHMRQLYRRGGGACSKICTNRNKIQYEMVL